MGKTRQPKPKVAKVNPIGIPSVRDVVFNEELLGAEGHPDGPITAMVLQLQSISAEEKMCALQSLSFLAQNQKRILEIIDSDIVKIIASWLMDQNKSIRNATAGALRNLSTNGIEVCENLVEQDVLTPVLALLNEYAVSLDWVPVFNGDLNNELDEKSDTFLQAINLVWNLCESTGVALENFNQTRVVQSFIRYLDYKVFGLDISIAVVQCLLVITEDNPACWNIIKDFGAELLSLLSLEDGHAYTLLSTLSAAILANIPAFSHHLNLIFTTLSKTLNVNHRNILAGLTSTIPLNSKKNEIFVMEDSNAMEDETDDQASLRRRKQDLPTEIEIEVKWVGWLLEAQRVAAETITNLCTIDDDDDADGTETDPESVDDFDDASSSHSISKNLENVDKLPNEILEAVKSLGLVEKLWQRAQPIAENVAAILKESEKSLITKVKTLRISSLLCLQNLCISMNTEDLGGPSAIYAVWLDLGQQVFQGTQNTNILEASTSLMRASLNHLKQSPDLFNQMTDNDLKLMLNGVKICTEPEIRANWLRMLGTLGCLLPEVLVKVIIGFILEASFREHDVWTISEAMDALMDMFADKDWDQIVYELNLVAKSRALERLMKNKLRQQKRELGERYSADSNGFYRNDRYRSTIQNGFQTLATTSPQRDRYVYSGSVTPTPRTRYVTPQSRYGSSQTSINSTNPFEEDDAVSRCESIDGVSPRKYRKKRKAPQPPITSRSISLCTIMFQMPLLSLMTTLNGNTPLSTTILFNIK